MNAFNDCAECGRSLTSLDIKHGWVTLSVGFSSVRVHTICRGKFEGRPYEQRVERAKAQWAEVAK